MPLTMATILMRMVHLSVNHTSYTWVLKLGMKCSSMLKQYQAPVQSSRSSRNQENWGRSTRNCSILVYCAVRGFCYRRLAYRLLPGTVKQIFFEVWFWSKEQSSSLFHFPSIWRASLLLLDPGKARGFSTNTFVIKSLINYLINYLKAMFTTPPCPNVKT